MSVNTDRRTVCILTGAAAGLLTVRFAAVLFGGQAFFYRDVLNFHYPLWQVTAEWVRAGHWPLWNPMVHFGVPVLGNANYLLMYPPAWIRFIVPPDLAFHLFFVGHLLLGAWAFYGLCRRVRVTPTGAAWAALWYAASGAVLSLHCVLNLVPYVFLAPWAMARLEAVLRRGSRADTAWLAVAWALVATVAEPLMVGGLVALTLGRLAVWALTRRRSRGFGTGWRCLAGAVGLAVLMSGPALLEGARLLAHSDRGGAGSSDPRVYAQHPLLAVELWLPEALGFRFDGTGAYRGRELGVVGNPYLVSIFIGFGTLPLLGAAVARGRRKSTVGMLAGAAVFLIAAAGGYLPTLSAMHAHLPVLAWGRYPQKFVLFAAGLLLIVAARGLDRIRRAGGRSAGRLSDLAWMLAPVAALVAAGLLIPGVSLRGLIPLAVLAIFVACLARTGFAGASHGRQWAQAAGAAILLELGWAGMGAVPVAPARILTEPAAVFERLAGRVDDRTDGRVGVEPHPADIQRPGQNASWFMLFFKNGGYPYFGVTQGVHYAFDLMLDRTHPRRMADFQRGFLARPPADRVRLLQRAGVRHLLSLRDYRVSGLTGADMIPLDDRHLLRVYDVPDAFGRCGFVGRWRMLPSGDMERLLAALVALPRDTVFVDDGTTGPLPSADAVRAWPSGNPAAPVDVSSNEPAVTPPARLHVRHDGPNRVVMDVAAPASGIVVFRDAFFTGWRVRVDDRDGTVCRVDGLFLGVAVDAGRHRVEFQYVPPFWNTVLVAAGLGLIITVGLLIIGRRRGMPVRHGLRA